MLQIVAVLFPLLAAFVVAGLLEWKPGWKAPAIGFAALSGVMLVAGIVSGGFGTTMAVLVFSTAFAALAAGVHLAAGHVASGLLAVLLYSTLFVGGPIVERSDPAVVESRLNLLIAVNPYPVMLGSIFDADLLRESRSLYTSSMADFRYVYPKWGHVAAGYAVAGLLLGAAGILRRRRKTA